MRIALAVTVMLLAGCVARQQANLHPVAVGVSTEADIVANLGQPIKTAVAPNGAKNDTFPMTIVLPVASEPPTAITYIFGADGKMRHMIWETASGTRYLLHEKDTSGVLPDEIVGPMPIMADTSIKPGAIRPAP